GKHGCLDEQEENHLKLPSSGKELAVIKEETLAITSTDIDPIISVMKTINRDSSSSTTLKNMQEHQIKSTKAEMGQVKEENERLKLLLAKIVKDYQSLQAHFSEILQKKEAKLIESNKDKSDHDNEEESHELVSLSLGRSSSSADDPRKNYQIKTSGANKSKDDELLLGLGVGFEFGSSSNVKNLSCDNSLEVEPKEENHHEPTEDCPPSKILKTARSSSANGDDDLASQQSHLKKARVSVRARCDTPTMNDGCQWRKYGQKIAKGNPCPRAYYRCTISPTCPVRKQVQRSADDMSILITTYEGTHNHPLPISATAMASTTSAAASMLQSNSTTSNLPSISTPSTSSSSSNLHHFPPLFQNSPQQFYFPNTQISTSNTNSHPTITLDLTAPNPSSHLRRLSSNTSSALPRYTSPTSLSFASSSSLEPNSHWSNFNGYFNRTPTCVNNQNSIASSNQSLTETISAATKAITTNPKFQSALAAALTSFVGNNGGSNGI
ncbi:hypothetical protein UlMin_041311, partial [Ulmus minor]